MPSGQFLGQFAQLGQHLTTTVFQVLIPAKNMAAYTAGGLELAKNAEGLLTTSIKATDAAGNLKGMAGLSQVPQAGLAAATTFEIFDLFYYFNLISLVSVASMALGQYHMVQIREQLSTIISHLESEKMAQMKDFHCKLNRVFPLLKNFYKETKEEQEQIRNRVEKLRDKVYPDDFIGKLAI